MKRALLSPTPRAGAAGTMGRVFAVFSLLCLLFLVGLAGPVSGSVMVPLDAADLVARADRIFVGTVKDQSAHWAGSDHRLIVTDVSIQVTKPLRGVNAGDVVVLRRLGGTVGEIGMKVDGEAAYQVGEEVLQFAERRGDSYYSVGMTQGKLHISSEGGRKLAEGTLSGAELLSRPGKSSVATIGPRPLSEVLRDLSVLIQKTPRVARGTR